MRKIAILLLLVLTAAGCGKKVDEKDTKTAAKAVTVEGCSNLYKVSDVLYRGAQPEKEGFAGLEKLGIKTVINLRDLHSDRKLIEGTGLEYEHIDMQAWDAELDEIEDFLKVATDESRQPIFVHCKHGADRTGTAVAVWRIVVEDWTKEDAIKEMTEGPFGFHEMWKGLPKFIEELDVEKLRRDLDEAK